MFSRSTAFGVGATITLVAGVIGLVGPERTREATFRARGNLRAVISPVPNSAIPHPDRSAWRSLSAIHKLLARVRPFGPAERGSEDEIRCALAELLTDENAAMVVQSLRSDELNTEFGLSALSRWAAKDQVAATLWVADQLTQSDEQTWAVAQALATDPVGLEVMAEILPATPWREQLFENASRTLLVSNPKAAVRLADRLQTGPARIRLLAGIAEEWAMREPEAAASWIAAEPDNSLRDELLFSSAVARASFDPASALDWANSISSEASYRRALDKIASIWTDASTEPVHRITALAALRRDVGARLD